jgi:hypothetical protein
MKKLTLPIVGVFGLTAIGLFAFNNPTSGNINDKCHIKIIKNINGIETIIDSTFDCDNNLTWVSADGENDGEKKEVKIMMIGDDENINVDSLLKTLNIKLDGKHCQKFIDENGNETILKDGDVKWISEDEDVIINEVNGEKSEIKIIKKVDDNGKVIVQKWVNGDEVEASEEDINKNHKVMMFKSKNGEDVEMIKIEEGEHQIMMDMDVEVMEDGKSKHIVIISNINTTNIKEIEKEFPAVATKITKNELEVDELTFSPNPNDGKFNLQFSTSNQKDPLSVKIFDLQGKEVYNETINKFSGKYSKKIDISEKGKGTYILQILQGNKSKTNKVLIK